MSADQKALSVGDVVVVDGQHECEVQNVYRSHDGELTVLVTINEVEQHVGVERVEKA